MAPTRLLVGLLALCVVLASPPRGASPAHAVVIFDSLAPTTGNGGFCLPACETGNLVGFAGTARDLTDFSVAYQASFALPGRTAIVRFYAPDGGGGAPGSKLFESASLAAPAAAGLINIGGFAIQVPDSLVWTVAFTAPPAEPIVEPPGGICICIREDSPDTAGPAAGLLQIGSADGSGWYRFTSLSPWNPLSTPLFAAHFEATGNDPPAGSVLAPHDPLAVPLPGTLVLLIAAAAVVGAWRPRWCPAA